MTARPIVLVTRPDPEGEALARSLEAEGFATLRWPLLRIAPTGEAAALAGAQAALFTSAAAARLTAPAPIPAFCVGAATAKAARAAGFADVRAAAGDAAALADLAASSLDPGDGPLAFARGADIAADLAGALRARGFVVTESVLYRAERVCDPPPDAAAALAAGEVAVATFYSARSAAVFSAAAARFREGLCATTAAAISPAVAEALGDCGFARMAVARAPDGDAMRAAIRDAAR